MVSHLRWVFKVKSVGPTTASDLGNEGDLLHWLEQLSSAIYIGSRRFGRANGGV